MKKEKFTLEYPLDNSSEAILWRMIGTPLGLAEWFADGVTVVGNEYTFNWDEDEEIAYLQEIKDGKYIRFQWEEDRNTNYFFQIEIVTTDLTGHVGLLITDFTEEGEKEDEIRLWNKSIEHLRRRAGM